MLFQSVRAKLPYRSSKEADGFTWQAWWAELRYRSQRASSQWRAVQRYLWEAAVRRENASTPDSQAGSPRLPGCPIYLQRQWWLQTHMSCARVHAWSEDGGALLSGHKVVFMSVGVVATQGSDRKRKPLILSVVHGLQLVGVQLCSAPAQVNQFCTTTPLHAVWWICTVLWSYGGGSHPPTTPTPTVWWQRGWSVLLKRFFFLNIHQMTGSVEGLAQVRPG